MFEELLPSKYGEELPYDILVDRSVGFSGSDIRLLCKEAAMQPLRRLMTQLEDKHEPVPEDGMYLLICVVHFWLMSVNCSYARDTQVYSVV